MSTTTNYRLGKLAQKSSALRNPSGVSIGVKNFYQAYSNEGKDVNKASLQSCPSRTMAQLNRQLKQQPKPKTIKFKKGDVGVDKSLANQLDELANKSNSKETMSSSTSNRTYKIFGGITRFSSASSLHGRCPMLFKSSARRWMSTKAQEKLTRATLSATQRRFQSLAPKDDRDSETARYISRSIQKDLMPIDEDIKMRLCSNQKKKDLDQTHVRSISDPLQGWKHPISYKRQLRKSASTQAAGQTEELIKQVKPSRRKLAIKSREHVVAEYIPSAMRKLHTSSEYRLDARRATTPRKVVNLHLPEREEDRLMDMPKRKLSWTSEREEDTEEVKDEQAEKKRPLQSQAERDSIKRYILDTPADESDNPQYPLQLIPVTLSAAQRVIKRQSECNLNQDRLTRTKPAKQVVDMVNPTPKLMCSHRGLFCPPTPPPKPPKKGSTDRLPTPDFKAKMLLPEKTRVQSMRVKASNASIPPAGEDDKSMQAKSSQHLNMTAVKSAERRSQSNMRIRELPKPKSTTVSEPPKPNSGNDLQMPHKYTKESALQRLGMPSESRSSHAYYLNRQRNIF